MSVPAGWKIIPGEREKRCSECGHVTPAVDWRLRGPNGRSMAMIGVHSRAGAVAMAAAVAAAYPAGPNHNHPR